MGVKLEDIVGNKKQDILEDKSKKTMNMLLIGVAIVVVLIVIVAIVLFVKNEEKKAMNRADSICRDANTLSLAIREAYVDAKQTGDESKLIGEDQREVGEDKIVKVTVNGQVLEFRYGYYYLTADEASRFIPGGLQVRSPYIVKYSTGEVVNLDGVKWKGQTYYEVDDLRAIADGKTGNEIPSNNTIFVNSPQDMQYFSQYPNSIFRLNRDIDMSYYANGDGWQPVNSFSGKFDGRGYKISNLKINNSSNSNAGLFGDVTSNALIQNLVLENIDVIGGDYTGGVAGAFRGTIQDCVISGRVSSTGRYVGGIFGSFEGTATNVKASVATSGGQYVGGFAGQVTGGIINKCSVNGSSPIIVVGNEEYTGGFTGYITANRDVEIEESCAVATVTSKKNAGGFIGSVNVPNSSYKLDVANCYAQGSIAACPENAGGFIGEISTAGSANINLKYNYTISKPTINCTQGRGGFVGSIRNANGTSVSYCYWERQSLNDNTLEESGVGYSTEGTIKFDPLTPDAIKQQRNFTGWDSVLKLWRFENGKSYPILSWE